MIARLRPALLVSCLGAALLLSGCIDGPGAPWGRLALDVKLRFAPPPGRLAEDGALKTVNDEAVLLDGVWSGLAGAKVELAAGDAPPPFDPANPPPGYSLCHHGHCHAADGSLPTYEEIAAELGVAQGASNVSWAGVDKDALALSADGVQVALSGCSPSCDVEDGGARRVELLLSGLRLTGQARGPKGAIGPVDVRVDKELRLGALLEVDFGREHDPLATLDVTVNLPASLLDDLQLAKGETSDGLPLASAASEAVARRVQEDASVNVVVTRGWPTAP